MTQPNHRPGFIYLVPAPDQVVRDPFDGKQLPPDGAHVLDTSYWFRRLAEGSVTQVQTTPEAPIEAAPAAGAAARKSTSRSHP